MCFAWAPDEKQIDGITYMNDFALGNRPGGAFTCTPKGRLG